MFEVALLLISALVTALLYRKRNAWGWIILYWAVLCMKNLWEVIGKWVI